jgi:hypothetical protein
MWNTHRHMTTNTMITLHNVHRRKDTWWIIGSAVAQRLGNVTLWHITAEVTTCSLLNEDIYIGKVPTKSQPFLQRRQAETLDTLGRRSAKHGCDGGYWWYVGGDWEECHPSWWSVRNVTKLQWYTRRHVPERSVVQAINSVSSCPIMPWNCLFSIPEICLWFTMRIKPKSAHEIMWIYYNVRPNLVYASAIFCGHLQGGIIWRIYYKDIKTNVII